MGLPALFDPEKYREDILMGRRRETGALNLKKLRPKHRMIIAYHLNGLTNAEIATILGYADTYVSVVLNDPMVQSVLARCYEDQELELRGLMPKAVDAIRTGLSNSDDKVKLKASDQYWRVRGRYKEAEKKEETAEDVIRRFLHIRSNGPIDVTIGEESKS